MTTTPSRASRLRVLLVLGRVSNLPTVWSDCVAAGLLTGVGLAGRLAGACLGTTLLYIGGMFLNDAVDVAFDRQYRAERPIPSGHIPRRTVGLLAGVWLALGWLVLLALGHAAGLYGLLLLVVIVGYDLVHKRTEWAVLLMACCRLLVYLAAAAAAAGSTSRPVVVRALALAAYIAGLSCLARRESAGGTPRVWPLGLLLVPAAVAGAGMAEGAPVSWPALVAFAAWLGWCLRGGFVGARRDFSRGVAGLLAGIVLVDWLAAPAVGGGLALVFGALFLLAVTLQRVAPAT